MRLTVFSDYTLRVLIYLGVHRNRLATIGEIAGAFGVSKNHLMKVVHHLGRHGYLETVRGNGGGVRLRLAPGAINVGTLVRVTETDTALVECFDAARAHCPILPACVLRGVLDQALEGFFQTLERYTLADLLKTQRRLTPLLSPGRRARRSRRAAAG